MSRQCRVLRVFTRGIEGGNPLGVITDSRGLSSQAMQTLAAELGFSETIYLVSGEDERPRVRIFTPANEMPFAGHPLVGMNWVLQRQRPGDLDSIECGIGPVGVRLDGETSWIDVPLEQPVELDTGLDAYDPGSTPRSVHRVAMPISYRIIELASSEAVRAAPRPSSGMVTVYARVAPHAVHTRFFAPSHGVPEDPATGSAAVALAACLQATGETTGSITIHQGAEIGAPSELRLRWASRMASIGGRVVEDEERIV